MKIKTNILVKIVAMCLLLALVTPVLSGCGGSVTDGAESTEEELRVVGTIGGYEVLYDEYRYVALTCKSILSYKYGEDIWSTEEGIAEYAPMLEEMIAERIGANYAVLLLCDANGFENALENKDAVKYVKENVDKTIYAYAVTSGLDVTAVRKGEDKYVYKYGKGELEKAKEIYKKALAEYYMTDRLIRLTLGVEYAFSKLSDILTYGKGEVIHKSEEIEAFMKGDEFICTKHIFIEKTKGKSAEEMKAFAEEAYQKYLDGATFESLIGSKYNADVSMPYSGYYFTKGEMDQAYEKAAFELEIGRVSELIETEEGYYIIQRCEKDESHMLDNLESYANQIVYAIVNQRVRTLQKNLTLEKNEFGASLKPYEIAP